MGFTYFFQGILLAAKKQVVSVEINPNLGSAAAYGYSTNIMYLERPVEQIDPAVLTHETVHAWDDRKDWYLSSLAPLNPQVIRKAEALAYGAQCLLDAFQALVRLRSTSNLVIAGDMSRQDWLTQWSNFWEPYRITGIHTNYPIIVGFAGGLYQHDFGPVTTADLADVQDKLGIAADYAKIAPLFGQ